MGERYENLKKRRASSDFDGQEGGADKDEDGKKSGDDRDNGDGEDGDKTPARKEAYDEDEAGPEDQSPKGKQRSSSIEYDPTDRESMVETVQKMLKQLKNID